MCGARLELRRETVVPSSSSSREPRRDFNYLLFGSDDCYVALGASAVSYSRALWSTAQAIRASLLANAAARTFLCSRLDAAISQRPKLFFSQPSDRWRTERAP